MTSQNHTKFLLVLLIIAPLLFSSCLTKKIKENKLAGTWEEIVHNSNITDKEQWVFNSDGLFTISLINDSGNIVIAERYVGEWSVQQKVSKAYLFLDAEPSPYYTFYEISKIKKTALILTVQDGGQYLREFKKIE